MNLSELIIAALLACPNLDISSRTSGDMRFSEYECRIRDGERGIIVQTALVTDWSEDVGYYCSLSYILTQNLNTKPGNYIRAKDCDYMKELDASFSKQEKIRTVVDDAKAMEILKKVTK
jgi:hypothetical protein